MLGESHPLYPHRDDEAYQGGGVAIHTSPLILEPAEGLTSHAGGAHPDPPWANEQSGWGGKFSFFFFFSSLFPSYGALFQFHEPLGQADVPAGHVSAYNVSLGHRQHQVRRVPGVMI